MGQDERETVMPVGYEQEARDPQSLPAATGDDLISTLVRAAALQYGVLPAPVRNNSRVNGRVVGVAPAADKRTRVVIATAQAIHVVSVTGAAPPVGHTIALDRTGSHVRITLSTTETRTRDEVARVARIAELEREFGRPVRPIPDTGELRARLMRVEAESGGGRCAVLVTDRELFVVGGSALATEQLAGCDVVVTRTAGSIHMTAAREPHRGRAR